MNTPKREIVVNVCQWMIANNATIDYPTSSQVIRPHVYRTQSWLDGYWKDGRHSIWDCSIADQQALFVASLLCQAAELGVIEDPSGYSYDGWGDTQSWLDRLPSYTNPKDAHIGALVVFGADGPVESQHGCIVIAADPKNGNPTLMSHGSMPGPLSISLADEQEYHTGSTVFLDVTSLGL